MGFQFFITLMILILFTLPFIVFKDPPLTRRQLEKRLVALEERMNVYDRVDPVL